jgi:hypothetical protein
MMPPPAISSSRFSQMKSGISAGSKPKSPCTRSWESLYIARAAFRPGSPALHNWRIGFALTAGMTPVMSGKRIEACQAAPRW